MNERLDMILAAVVNQEPMLFVVDGEVWEGHIADCTDGVVRAVVRRIRQTRPYTERCWCLEQIADMGRQEPPQDDEPEDELLAGARLMVQQAREYSEMSLAERILRNRAT